jgi:hypothetical protein
MVVEKDAIRHYVQVGNRTPMERPIGSPAQSQKIPDTVEAGDVNLASIVLRNAIRCRSHGQSK